jgi:RNA polymerase sigma-70 factor (ECF subfamily)
VTRETDVELIRRLVRGRDSRAFDELYLRHTDALYGTAMRLMGDADNAADVVHDAWIKAYDNLHRFEGRSALRTWLTGILINCARNRWRDERDVIPLDMIADVASTPPITLDVDPIDLEAAIVALPPRYRAVLVLHDVEGFTHDEIADMLGIVQGTSKSQLARARARIREALTTDKRKRAQ